MNILILVLTIFISTVAQAAPQRAILIDSSERTLGTPSNPIYTSGLGGYQSGNVGIGTSSPTQALSVVGNITATGYIESLGTGDSYFSGQNVGIGTLATVYSTLAIKPLTNVFGIKVGSTYAITNHPGQTDSIVVQGNVGIGTFAPAGVLDVNRKLLVVGNNVGIGSVTPGYMLDVAGNIRSTTDNIGWSIVDQTDNQACTTGCTSACVFGIANATGTAVTNIVSCSDTTADLCLCAGGD